MLEATRRMMGGTVSVAVAVFGFAFAPAAFADLFKCTVGGKVQYQQTACASGEEKALDDSNRRMLQREREAKERLAKQEADALTAASDAKSRLAKQETDALTAKGATGAGNEGERKARAEQAMRSYFEQTLIDPSSVQFRNLQVFLDVPGSKLRTSGSKSGPLVDVVCGEMNSKNRMGGYVGFKHFYWDSDEKKAVGPLDDRQLGAIMEDLARRTCAKLS